MLRSSRYTPYVYPITPGAFKIPVLTACLILEAFYKAQPRMKAEKTEAMRAALEQQFGLRAFRPPQEDIIQDVLAGRNCLVIMPTGGGKSLCYQLPALMLPGVTIVVSPLIALMKDQVDGLRRRGIGAGFINSTQSWGEQIACLEDVHRGEIKLLYVAPERFRAASFLQALAGLKVSLMAIDEAHCLSQWGHDFRPDYLRLGAALKAAGGPPCLALTATATPDVREDILNSLELADPQIYVSGFARPNLSFEVVPVERVAEKVKRVTALIREHRTGIIYGATRKSVESISGSLSRLKIPHVLYHGGLPDAERTRAQERFMRGEVHVAVATNAFGMGIDRADIRFVCHYEMPGSVEAYYQEGGRAGRDGHPAVCQLLFSYADKRIQEFFIAGANPGKRLVLEVFSLLREKADAQHEVLMSIDDLTESIGRKVNPMAVGTALAILGRHRLLERYDVPGQRARGTRLLQPDIPLREIALDEKALMEKADRDEKKLQAVIQFAYAKTCRQQWILRYFGEKSVEDCGQCDVCVARGITPRKPLSDEEILLVRKALSVVARMSTRIQKDEWEPRYGRMRIIQCACGSVSSRFPPGPLQELSTWGILKAEGKKFVTQLFDALETAGLVESVPGKFPLLGLTVAGSRAMRGDIPVALHFPRSGLREKRLRHPA